MKLINAPKAPAAIGPYSHAVSSGGFLYCSGQLPLDPASMKIIEGDAAAQAQQVLNNMRAVLDAEGLALNNVVKTTILLADMADFPSVNEVYGAEFGDHKPARSTFQVAGLPLGASVEIECIAEIS